METNELIFHIYSTVIFVFIQKYEPIFLYNILFQKEERILLFVTSLSFSCSFNEQDK